MSIFGLYFKFTLYTLSRYEGTANLLSQLQTASLK